MEGTKYRITLCPQDGGTREEQLHTGARAAWEAFRLFAEPDSVKLYRSIDLGEVDSLDERLDCPLARFDFPSCVAHLQGGHAMEDTKYRITLYPQRGFIEEEQMYSDARTAWEAFRCFAEQGSGELYRIVELTEVDFLEKRHGNQLAELKFPTGWRSLGDVEMAMLGIYEELPD